MRTKRLRIPTQALDLETRLHFQRWIAAIGLIATADESARGNTPETNAMSLLAAHAACESALGLLAGVREDRRDHDVPFGELVRDATEPAGLQPDLVANLHAMHRMRNAFVHASNAVHELETSRATSTAHRLIDLATKKVGLTEHPPPIGIGSAIATVIQVEFVGLWLGHADEMLLLGETGIAADDCARALHSALVRASPPLHPNDSLSSRSVATSLQNISGGGYFDRDSKFVAERIDGLNSWVLPLALGLQPTAYDAIHRTVGTIVPTWGRPLLPVDRSVRSPDSAEVKRALGTIASVIFRLWAMGSLAPWESDDENVAAAQAFLADPIGETEKNVHYTRYGDAERAAAKQKADEPNTPDH